MFVPWVPNCWWSLRLSFVIFVRTWNTGTLWVKHRKSICMFMISGNVWNVLLWETNSFWESTSLFTILKAKDSPLRLVKWMFSVSYCYVGFLPVQKLSSEAGRKNNVLPTGTRVHCHVGVDLEDHVLVFIKEEDAEGRHLLWYTAGLWDARDHSHCPHNALNGGVVWRFQRLQEVKKVKVVSYPYIILNLLKVDVNGKLSIYMQKIPLWNEYI